MLTLGHVVFCRAACADSGCRHVTRGESSLLKKTQTQVSHKEGACPDEYLMDTHTHLLSVCVQTKGVFTTGCLVDNPLLCVTSYITLSILYVPVRRCLLIWGTPCLSVSVTVCLLCWCKYVSELWGIETERQQ